jgi:hypothetical protein
VEDQDIINEFFIESNENLTRLEQEIVEQPATGPNATAQSARRRNWRISWERGPRAIS